MPHTLRVTLVAVLLLACGLGPQPSARSEQAPASSQAPALELQKPARLPVPLRSAINEVTLGKSGQQCVAVDFDSSTYAKAGQTVRWLIDNGCNADQTVEVVTFVDKATNRAASLFPKGPAMRCTAPPGGRCQIVLRVPSVDPAGGHGNKVYTYSFSLTGKDPELVIEWP